MQKVQEMALFIFSCHAFSKLLYLHTYIHAQWVYTCNFLFIYLHICLYELMYLI